MCDDICVNNNYRLIRSLRFQVGLLGGGGGGEEYSLYYHTHLADPTYYVFQNIFDHIG